MTFGSLNSRFKLKSFSFLSQGERKVKSPSNLDFLFMFDPVILAFQSDLKINIRSWRCNIEWVGRVLVFTSPVIPDGPPPNSSFKVEV